MRVENGERFMHHSHLSTSHSYIHDKKRIQEEHPERNA
jgi:hypothetical protein